MESIMLTVKLVIMYGFVVFVVAVVGATVIAGLYQLIRNRGAGLPDQVHESHVA